MVSPSSDPQQRKHSSLPFLSHHDGAPPTPPPGGYQHGRRFPSSPFATAVAPQERPQRTRSGQRMRHPLGWIAIAAGAVFALVLLIALAAGATDAIYGVTMLALQLIVVAVAVAAVVVTPSRVLGAWALAIVLLLNVGTVGAMGSLRTSAAGTYGDQASSNDPASAYPGVKGVDDDLVQEAPSLEDTRKRMEELSKAIRKRLSADFGYTWVQVSDPLQRDERNGYGGESMLQEYTAPVWATKEPIHDFAEKTAVMETINRVLAEEGLYYSMYPLNENSEGSISEDSADQLYGGTDPRTQVRWSHYTQLDDPAYATDAPESPLFYAEIIDLTHDDTGRWRKQQEAEAKKNGAPLEGLQLVFRGGQLLSEKDRDAFQKALKEHPEPGGQG